MSAIDVNINLSKFDLKPEYFDQRSMLHGIMHTYRVMVNCLVLGTMTGHAEKTRLAFFAAFVHDMARRHDGYCSEHGRWAVENKLPQHSERFAEEGVSEEEISEIATAIENHSRPVDLAETHEHYLTTSLLKDADALDRIRLGARNLDPSYLRFEESHQLINFATELYYQTIARSGNTFKDVFKLSEKIKKSNAI